MCACVCVRERASESETRKLSFDDWVQLWDLRR